MQLAEFIDVSNRSTAPELLFARYAEAMATRGFDRVCFTLLTDHPTIDRAAGHSIMNYPPEWARVYAAKNYAAIDPVRQFLPAAEGPFRWEGLLRQKSLTPAQAECLRLAASAGLRDGIGVPLRGPGSALAGIGAASSKGGADLRQVNLDHVQLLSQQFYVTFLRLERQQRKVVVIVLSGKEREVLQYFAVRKTKQEVGVALGISESTVKFHIRNAQQKLNAKSGRDAVLRALQFGLIQVP